MSWSRDTYPPWSAVLPEGVWLVLTLGQVWKPAPQVPGTFFSSECSIFWVRPGALALVHLPT